MKYIRRCPSCQSERPVHEMYCQNTIDNQKCSWLLMNVTQTPAGGKVEIESKVEPEQRLCENGHKVGENDFMCMECGADIQEPSTVIQEQTIKRIDVYTVVETLHRLKATKECFLVKDDQDKTYFLTLYHQDYEPDKAIYDVLKKSDVDHVAELIQTGYWEERFFEVSEHIIGGSIDQLEYLDKLQLETLIDEIGRALRDFSDTGIRHRDLCPQNILVRDQENFDLVVIDFSSARLSDYDLDTDTPLELTRYTAPEAIIGGVSPASDWWSLGMIVLEQITKGAFFENINDKAFMIHLVTRGVQLPTDIDERILLLLQGLLCRDPLKRWNWSQVEKWLNKEYVAAPISSVLTTHQKNEKTIKLGDELYSHWGYFALAAAEEINWEEGLSLFTSGAISNWIEETSQDKKFSSILRNLRNKQDIDVEWRFSLALMHLNPSLPLTWRGQIIIPAWLLSNPKVATEIIEGNIPEYLEDIDREKWLVHLKTRKEYILQKAKNLEIELDQDRFTLNALSTSRVRLKTEMDVLRQLYPDAENISLSNLMGEIRLSEEDMILIVSANRNQFITLEKLTKQAVKFAERHELEVQKEFCREMLVKPRLEIYDLLTHRLEGFSKSNHDALNRWADRFRIEKRLPLIQSVLCLSLPQNEWITPPKHEYASNLLRFFERKIVHASSRGPLVRLIISTHSARIDLQELGTSFKSSEKILSKIVNRFSGTETIDPKTFSESPFLERRTRRMLLKADNFKRDTGLESLYLGFPFLVSQGKLTHRPKILPMLLWPVQLQLKNRNAPKLEIGFDQLRGEIRLNPALGSVLDRELFDRIKKETREILGKPTLTIQEVMDAFGSLIAPKSSELTSHTAVSYMMKESGLELHCSAVFFNANFTGQAISEDMRTLQKLSHSGTAMESILKIKEPEISDYDISVSEKDRYTVVSVDPSQEKAVMQSRLNPGIVIEGPPGTGKSQTIVNIISDCIGRKEKVLVVSQKRAAIQVILKRLEAVNLENRVMAITDISRDRQNTIRSVREQIPNYLKKSDHQFLLREMEDQREHLTQQIDRIESHLDTLSEEIHVVDSVSKTSYRNILSELIELQSKDYIDVPEARGFLENKTASELNILEEQVKGFIHYWMPSHFESSTLFHLKVAQFDEATKKAVQNDLEHFYQAEENRISCLQTTSNKFDGSEVQFYADWLLESEKKLQNITEVQAIKIQKWFDLLYDEFNDQSIAQDISEALIAMSNKLGDFIRNLQFEYFLEALQKLTDDELDNLIGSCDFYLSTSIFKYINPFGFVHYGRLKKVLKAHNFRLKKNYVQELKIALEQEQSFRGLRQQFNTQLQKLQVSVETVSEAKMLLVKIGSQQTELEEIIQLVDKVKSCPAKKEARYLLKTGKVTAYQEFVKELKDASERYALRKESFQKLEDLSHWLIAETTLQFHEKIQKNDIDISSLKQMLKDMPHYIPYQKFRMRLGDLKAYEELLGVFVLLREYEPEIEKISSEEWSIVIGKTIRREGLLGWKQRIEKETPALLMSENEIKLNVDSLQELLGKVRSLNRQLLNYSLDVDKLGTQSEWNSITRLRGRNYKKLREFVSLGSDIGLMDLRPVWLMSPEVVSQAIPLQAGLFDVIIFDEASQMLIDHSIPALYRAKRVIISGDEKQMPPTGFFAHKMDDEEEIQELELSEDKSEEELARYQDAWNQKEVKDCPDLLTLAKTVLPVTTLEIHYRSQFKSLINFSNHAFYAGQLHIPAFHPKNEIISKKPLEVLRVDGIYNEQTNEAEADVLIDFLTKHWQLPEEEILSTGIVTFNKKQAELIEDKIQERELSDEDFRAVLNRERNKQQEGEDMGFFVKNVENVQGDERDMILFSTTFGFNPHGVFRRNFGALGHRGGERRLNVAITRSRYKVVIATSMPIKDISDMLATGRPPSKPRDYIQSYLNYAEIHSDTQIEIANKKVQKLSTNKAHETLAIKNDGFKNTVKEYIHSLGYETVENSDDNVFYLDLAIENNGRFVIGIECDTPNNSLLKSARYRELWRLQVLKKSIPVIHRTTSYRWLKDAQAEQNRLKEAIQYALNS